ncbi:hypothetical protein E2I00_002403 [Balaenoptera physalus]|uniref:NACHT domain-containing protein n=1 Tax=Balaenoptera physalus TaxID=9770 RepID=A0A643CIJ3_BALPH|nr:hypothetical protein E2I00_002403 [Balaenoptera physalus]
MELGPLEGGYLELLNSNADPLQLYHLYDRMDLAGEEEIELCSGGLSSLWPLPSPSPPLWPAVEMAARWSPGCGIPWLFLPEPDTDTINCEQFSRLLCDMEGDEETREAYANIVEHIGLEEMISESVEVLEEAGQKSQKRPEPLAMPVVTGAFLVGLVSDSSAQPCPSPPALFNKEPASSQTRRKDTGEVPQASQTPPLSNPAVHSLPKSPDRPGSTSPFAPSAADLPSMPEPALTSRANLTVDEMSPTQCPAAHKASRKLPKWPVASPATSILLSPTPHPLTCAESVEQFYCSLRSKYQAKPAGPEGILVEVDLVRVRLERSGSKSQDRELTTLDWAERQPARGGLGEVLLASSNHRRPRETQYDFIFCIPCHCLDRPGDTYRLQDLLFSLGSQPLSGDDEVFSYILRRPDRILLILDAFEELEAQDGFLHSAGGPMSAEFRSLRGLLASLFQRKLLRGCTLLLTARPRGRLAQSLSKADALFEVAGFSAQQAETYPFLLSHSHSPTVCRAVCQLSEALLELGDEAQLPSTLTGLYVGLLGPGARDSPPGALVGLARLAWELGRGHQSSLREGQFPSAEVRAWAVAQGLVQPTPGAPETELAFSSFLLQCFLGAVWLALSSEIKDKELPQYLALTPRKKRPYDNWLEGVPRFLAGRLLELLHCAHEALDAGLWQHVLQGLPAHLSFLGTRLTPPDTHVLGSALEAAGRDFSLDLRSTGVEPSGLGNLVGLSCVTHFSDTVELWESLQQHGEAKLLRAVKEKFTIEPFKAESMKDVEDLGNLVQIQRTRSSSEDTPGELPAVRDLKKLEFALGPILGPQAFPKLVKILEAFSSLQHLDLSQNNITDLGACKLAEALPLLAASLLRLSLYNNCICDVGAESLAHVLPDMVSLRVLDVQYNKFTAAGAQQLTASLRKCPHVEKLAMWTPTIPFGVQEHLQQLDSRIILR